MNWVILFMLCLKVLELARRLASALGIEWNLDAVVLGKRSKTSTAASRAVKTPPGPPAAPVEVGPSDSTRDSESGLTEPLQPQQMPTEHLSPEDQLGPDV
jgi:hypothetical protein